ncbi:hypothetical protein [Dehalobacterium formicoaceticum]|uniref:Uncharacterized protein n=1 Tax=Dehalobacterium formicoaceticum TaxID=51515 RepID=A0ABT1Y524_9FIRM|nr:hypothetical protein [Dehalobacterium formicoaceticum]MCR6545611.1 hypothetical protein [Dehalobacterium formicoaceticum]
MFPLTHSLTAQKLIENPGARAILGSVFPDLANVIGLHRDETHEMGLDFYRFCHNHYQEHLDFARGVISHGANPQGLDFYADQSFAGQNQGYCFQRGSIIVDQVVKTCGIPKQMGLWKAHNFIEMTYDVITAERYPYLLQDFQEALADKDAIEDCSMILGKYFQIDRGKIKAAFLKMPEFFCLNEVTPLHLAEKYALQLQKRHGIYQADPPAMAEVLAEARDLVEDEFMPFMDGVYERLCQLMAQFPK